MANVIKFKRGTTANVAKLNGVDLPLLQEGEIAIDITTKTIKVGDGLTAWNNLSGINADTLDSFHASQGTDANNVAVRNADGKLPGDILGNSETSTKLKTPRTIAISGDATGSATFDGSADATIAATVNNAAQAAKLTTARTISLGGDASGSITFDGTANKTLTATVNQAAKLKTPRTITISGDASGSTSFDGSENVTINATVSNAAQATKLTTARTIALSGDASGSVTFDGTADKTISTTVSQAAKLTTPRTITLSGNVSGSTSFDGSTNVTINSTVNDSAKVGGYSPATTATANTVAVRDADGKLPGDILGNAATATLAANATKLATARTISLTGGVTGSTNFDGSSNKTIVTTVTNDSHTHTISTITDIANASVAQAVNADKLGNYNPSTTATASTVPVRDSDGKLPGDILGNAATATKLANARTISLGGDASGSATFDGSANVTISATVNDSAKVGGYSPSKTATANTIPVRDANGKLAGDILGNAATATSATSATTATKLATARTIALSGDVTGSTTFDGSANKTITTTVVDDSHNHTISTITDIANASVAHAANASKLNNYSTDVAATANTIPVRDDNGQLVGDITGNAATATNAATLAGLLPSTANEPNTVVVRDEEGNIVGGTIVGQIDSADKVDGYHASPTVVANTIPVRDANGKLPGDILGNAATATTATKLATARTISLTGDASGSASFDGSANASITATVAKAAKLTTARTIALSGDATGSATFDGSANVTISTTVNNSAKVGGYSPALTVTANTIPVRDDNGQLVGDITGNAATATSATSATTATKLATARTLALSGDATGSATFDGSANATISTTVNNAAKAAKLSTARTISLTGDVAGSTTFDGSANASISTTVNNSAKVGGYSPATTATANTIPVRDANGKIPGDILGNAATATSATSATTATKLATARTISLSGDITGSTTFDGSANASISATVNNSAKVGGYSPSTTATANTIPVRNADGKLPGDILGNAATATSATSATRATTATKLATARTIALGGDASGSANFDGSANVTISATVNNAAKVGGYSPSTTATASTVPVRDTNGKLAGDILGNAATATTASSATTATKLATARTISLTGDVTGSTTFDGSANKSIATTVNNSAKVGGYSPSTSATANAVAVRDANGKLPGDITGNAATATTATSAGKLTTSRTIALSGDATGSTTFDGSGNATIVTTVSNAAKLAGYSPNTSTGANTIPVRNSSGALPGNILGNAATATKLATARTISLTGDVTGSASFDGSSNVSIATTANVPNFIAATWTTTKPTNFPTHGKTFVTQQIITIPAGAANIMYYFPYKFNSTDGVMFDIWISFGGTFGAATQYYYIFYGNDSEACFWSSKPKNDFTDYINCNYFNKFSGQVQVIGEEDSREKFCRTLLTPGPYYLKLKIYQSASASSFTINLSTRLYYY